MTAFTEGTRNCNGRADSTPCRATIPRDAGPVFHGIAGHRSTASRAGSLLLDHRGDTFNGRV